MTEAYFNKSPFNEISGEVLREYRFVKLSGTTVIYADAGDEPIGMVQTRVASGVGVSIAAMLGGISKVFATKAIANNALLYVADEGKVSDAAIGVAIGQARQAATAHGDVISAIIWGPRGGNDLSVNSASRIKMRDDFRQYDPTATVGGYAEVADAGSSAGVVLEDAHGGVLSISPDGDDNDEAYVSTMSEILLIQAGKFANFAATVKLAEVDVDNTNIIIGLSDNAAADFLQDDGAGPAASFDGVCIFKVDGGTVWQAITSNVASQNIDTNLGAFTDDTWTDFLITVDPNDGVTAIVKFYINGVLGATEDLVLAGLAEMHVVMGIKQGDTEAENAFKVDVWEIDADR